MKYLKLWRYALCPFYVSLAPYIVMSILITSIVHADDGGLDDSGKPKLKFHYNQRVGFYVNKFFGYCSGTVLDWRQYEVGYGDGVYYIIGDTQCQGVSADVYSHRDEKDLKVIK